ncbi:MAG TPA: glycosyltransferase family 87 protein [Chloroflexota bacterium]|nr:glycosyltransferase family 87 protein [Chloroflexota bacterium]
MTARLLYYRPRHWLHLGLAVVALLYMLFVALMLAGSGLFTYVGMDYLAALCTLRFVQANGFAHAYDLAAQARFHQLANASVPAYAACDTPPLPYLPVFLALFEPLALLPPALGFALWTALNLTLFIAYCYRFGRAIGRPCRPAALLKLVLAYALYENLVAGQVNVLLFACFGEVILAYSRGQRLRSGLWLGGLLLKPQALLLVLPGLVLGRRLKLLLGFALACLALGGVSLALAGVGGMVDLGRLLRYYSAGLGPTFPEAGMNWRGLAINLAPLVGEPAAWALALPGLVVTVVAGLAVWLAPRHGRADDQLVVALLGSFAASSAATWHSHVYSGLPLLAPLLYLSAGGRLPEWLFNAWLAGPAAAFFIAAFTIRPTAGHPAAGLTMLLVNVLLVAWATRTAWRPAAAAAVRDAARHPLPRVQAPGPTVACETE